ncbi:MAG: nucleotidyltransferase [Eubacteriales bacterium]|nr:nucleotidyltransferase [Eubacteriales bacterium]
MKIVGLITEYNPFHNGHQYHIQKSLEITGADAAIVVMSGDYVQRGTPAIMPKHLRAEMALRCGAAAVFELPVCYATATAELFALGAVSFLEQLGIVDFLCFGSECNDLRALQKIAEILFEEPAGYTQLLKRHLKNGISFPAARQKALSSYMGISDSSFLLNDPNNILGIEYLKALRRVGSKIRPFTIKRMGADYHDQTLRSNYSSASAIRSLLAYSSSMLLLQTEPIGNTFENTPFSSILNELEDQVPKSCLTLLKDYHKVLYPVYQNDFSLLMKYKLLNKTPKSLMRYMDVSETLANRIQKNLNEFFNYRQFCELLKTKELTQTRINRALLHIMLGLKKKNVREYMENGGHFYARLLGFRKDHQKLLSAISKQSTLPLLTRLSDIDSIPEIGQKMLRDDILASNLYQSVITDQYKTAFRNEYKQPMLKI